MIHRPQQLKKEENKSPSSSVIALIIIISFVIIFYNPNWNGFFRFAILLSGSLLFILRTRLRYIIDLLVITIMALLLFFKIIPGPYYWITDDNMLLSVKLIINYLYFICLIILPLGLFNLLISHFINKKQKKEREAASRELSFYYKNNTTLG